MCVCVCVCVCVCNTNVMYVCVSPCAVFVSVTERTVREGEQSRPVTGAEWEELEKNHEC